jgi:hypothetical protein
MQQQFRAPYSPLNLLIIAKTLFGEKHCYIGLDMFSERLLRPIPDTSHNECFWYSKKYEFHVGEQHLFEVICYAPEEVELPHQSNDILVSYIKQISASDEDIYKILYPQGEDNMEDVFAAVEYIVNPHGVQIVMIDVMVEEKYVMVNENCPSCGILRCKGRDLSLQERMINKKMKKSCKITNNEIEFDLPMTAVNHDSPLPNDDVLVILFNF